MAVDRSFAKLGARVDDLGIAAADRLAEAELLFAAGRYSSAVMMGLYALEIQLKVLICRRLDLDQLPRAFETHDLEGLLVLAGLSRKIKSIKRPRGVEKNWIELLRSSEEINDFRYVTKPGWDHAWATKVLGQLRDTPNGVLPWLSKQA
ncbi:MAG: hypothetical protein P4L84_15000 [Isosphaeraceae bacterium]|nr:hypothetical protein [Isosphaeraceae bacterium]